MALALSTSGGLWVLYAHPAAAPQLGTPAPVAPPLRGDATPPSPPAPKPVPRRDDAMLDPSFAGRYKPVTFAQSAPLDARFEWRQPIVEAAAVPPLRLVEPRVVSPLAAIDPIVEEIPLPAPRPARLLPGSLVPGTTAPFRGADPRRIAQDDAAPIPPVAPAPTDTRTFFQRMFGRPQTTGNALAYAAPDDGGLGNTWGRPAPYDRWTAVYVISEHTVYLPDGTRLEAHSGLGNSLDDPRSVAERMRGATPPNTYELQPREQLFHGVRALRLNPAGDGTTYGRAGLLAHTYMLGPRGDSNGCVVFKNYKAFLQAYDAGEVKRLAVVARLN